MTRTASLPLVLPTALRGYAARLHAAAGTEHHVASPLGAWLLLAAVGPAARGAARAELEAALGMDADAAADALGALLADPHPAVAAAAAGWSDPRGDSDALRGFAAGLPAGVGWTPHIPGQEALDAWADERTGGQIRRFPLQVTDDTRLLLASALATRVSWTQPFGTAAATELGTDAPLAAGLSTVLRAGTGHGRFIVATEHGGDVAVVTGRAAEGLLVVSVAADPSVPATTVLDAAHDLAITTVVDPAALRRRSLFDLPLGDGPAWTLTEADGATTAADGCESQVEALLPAWTASSRHDLLADAGTAFAPAVATLTGLLRPDPAGFDAQAAQSAVAEYTRTGFSAAAVTAIGVLRGMMMPATRPGVIRTATLRFGHPHAVVAVAVDPAGRRDSAGPWHGLPVFSAWVTRGVDAAREPELPTVRLRVPRG